jgi:hypothetical protein
MAGIRIRLYGQVPGKSMLMNAAEKICCFAVEYFN